MKIDDTTMPPIAAAPMSATRERPFLSPRSSVSRCRTSDRWAERSIVKDRCTRTTITLGGPGKVGGPPVQSPTGTKTRRTGQARLDGREQYRGGSLTIKIRNWDTGQSTPLTLKPSAGRDLIELKIANLCEDNPLEWKEFENRLQKDDVDFKWLYRLFEAKTGGRLLDVFGGRGHKLPYPKLAPRRARTTGNTGCTPGQFRLP